MILSPTKLRPLRWLLLALTGLCVFGLALLLSRGTAGGDESLPVQDAILLWAGGGKQVFHSSEMFLLAHRFFWFLEKCAWRGLLLLVMPAGLRQNAIAQDALMAADSVLFMFAALFVMAHHLRRCGYTGPVTSLTAGSLFFASSAISFFSGGVLECQMIFFAVVIAAVLDDARTSIRWAALLLASFCLILCKGYALFVLLPLTLLLPRRRDQIICRAETGSNMMLLIPMPFWLVLSASRLMAALPFLPKIDRERILGLAGTRFRPSEDDLEALGLKLDDPAARLVSHRFAARARLREGIVLLHYLLSGPAPRKSIVRFARLLEAYGETALDIPITFRAMPGLLRLCDPIGGQSALARHLQVAAMVAEDPKAAGNQIHDSRILELILEILALPIRLFAGRQVP